MIPGLVIFDCDGVLVDTEPATNVAIAANLTRHGLQESPDDCMRLFVGGTIASLGEKAREMGADLPEDWVAGMYADMEEVLREGVEVYPGVFGILDLLDSRSIPYAIASNGPERKMAVTLTPSGLHARFAGAIYSAHRVKSAKPEPGMLLAAASDFGVAPERCVMIDDNPAGIIAANRAGMRAVGFDEFSAPERLARHGAEVISHMSELAPLLGLADRKAG